MALKESVITLLITFALILIVRGSADSNKTQGKKVKDDFEKTFRTLLEKKSKKMAEDLVKEVAEEMSDMNGKK